MLSANNQGFGMKARQDGSLQRKIERGASTCIAENIPLLRLLPQRGGKAKGFTCICTTANLKHITRDELTIKTLKFHCFFGGMNEELLVSLQHMAPKTRGSLPRLGLLVSCVMPHGMASTLPHGNTSIPRTTQAERQTRWEGIIVGGRAVRIETRRVVWSMTAPLRLEKAAAYRRVYPHDRPPMPKNSPPKVARSKTLQ